MIKVENIEVFNFEGALRGMRNPFMSHAKSDSGKCSVGQCKKCVHGSNGRNDCTTEGFNTLKYSVGKDDMELCKKLIKGGSPHRKFLRQIFISMDITGPWYWWKQFEQYKIGTTTNSESSMHAINKRGFTLNDFSTDRMIPEAKCDFEAYINLLNEMRELYVNHEVFKEAAAKHGENIPTKKEVWYSIIQMLPSSFNQTRTATMSYENALNIIQWRSNHKLDEWRIFCDILINELPYMKEFVSAD